MTPCNQLLEHVAHAVTDLIFYSRLTICVQSRYIGRVVQLQAFLHGPLVHPCILQLCFDLSLCAHFDDHGLC